MGHRVRPFDPNGGTPGQTSCPTKNDEPFLRPKMANK